MLEGADPGGPESNNHFAWKYENNSAADSVCSSVSTLCAYSVHDRRCSRNTDLRIRGDDVSRLTCSKFLYDDFSL